MSFCPAPSATKCTDAALQRNPTKWTPIQFTINSTGTGAFFVKNKRFLNMTCFYIGSERQVKCDRLETKKQLNYCILNVLKRFKCYLTYM